MNGPLIVVVEDDECIRSSIAEALELEGYRIVTYPNGFEAAKGLPNQPRPSLILLDWMMPVMGGEAFLKAREKFGAPIADIPVVVLSAVAEKACGKTGVETCLEKPVDLDRLLDTVGGLCSDQKCA